MPFVRFSRDKRGYEHVYLIESSNDRGRSRVLYWFRTPPGVKVGRSAFDTDTQRSLERQNPDVKFDWPQITAARMPPPVPVENWREKRRAERAFKRARAAETIEVAELEHSAAVDDAAPVADELDEPLDELEEALVGESSEIVEVSEEPVPQALTESAGDLTPDSTHDTSPQLSPVGAVQPPGGRRKRRRRRRRHSGNRPDATTQCATGPNEPLDPADPSEKPSNEE